MHVDIKPGKVAPADNGAWKFSVIHPVFGEAFHAKVFVSCHEAKRGMREFVNNWNKEKEE